MAVVIYSENGFLKRIPRPKDIPTAATDAVKIKASTMLECIYMPAAVRITRLATTVILRSIEVNAAVAKAIAADAIIMAIEIKMPFNPVKRYMITESANNIIIISFCLF